MEHLSALLSWIIPQRLSQWLFTVQKWVNKQTMDRWVVCHPVTSDASPIQQLLGYGCRGVYYLFLVVVSGCAGCLRWEVPPILTQTATRCWQGKLTRVFHGPPLCRPQAPRRRQAASRYSSRSSSSHPRPSRWRTSPCSASPSCRPRPPPVGLTRRPRSVRRVSGESECGSGSNRNAVVIWDLCKTERMIFHRSHILCVCVLRPQILHCA